MADIFYRPLEAMDRLPTMGFMYTFKTTVVNLHTYSTAQTAVSILPIYFKNTGHVNNRLLQMIQDIT